MEKENGVVPDAEEALIAAAVKNMGLDDLRPFDPRRKVIEYRMEDLV